MHAMQTASASMEHSKMKSSKLTWAQARALLGWGLRGKASSAFLTRPFLSSLSCFNASSAHASGLWAVRLKKGSEEAELNSAAGFGLRRLQVKVMLRGPVVLLAFKQGRAQSIPGSRGDKQFQGRDVMAQFGLGCLVLLCGACVLQSPSFDSLSFRVTCVHDV